MKRIPIAPRAGWQARVEAIGFAFHTNPDGTAYWDESACWHFSAGEIDTLEAAAETVYALCERAVDRVIEQRLYDRLGLPAWVAPAVEASWRHHTDRDLPLYARFDFAWNGEGAPKALELNAETPTSLYEASVVQWCWLQDVFPDSDQFNSIEEQLVKGWQARMRMHPALPRQQQALHLACLMPHAEDEATVAYLQSLALKAGMTTKVMPISGIRYDDAAGVFLDGDGHRIDHLFKLYPWDWLIHEDAGRELVAAAAARRVALVEPAWKMVMASKGLFALLWEMFPGHENLLPTAFRRAPFPAGSTVVAKPLLGREGANVSIATLGADGYPAGPPLAESGGPYDEGGWVYQAYHPLAEVDGNRAVLGVWMAGGKACGLGIREDRDLITGNAARFVPHRFEGDEAEGRSP